MGFQKAFGKDYSSKPKQPRRTWTKNAFSTSDLMTSALARHNIGRQVNAAMIVTAADNVLRGLVDSYMKPDVKVLSYKHAQLVIACRHPAAVNAMHPLCDMLKQRIEETIPNANIVTVIARMHPEAWTEEFG